jgi:pilus assembly protein CpaB
MQLAVLIPAVVLAAALDWKYRRIPNALTALIAVAGVSYLVVEYSTVAALGRSGQGVVAGLACMPIYVLRGMSAGDVKLISATSIWWTTSQLLIALASTAIVGAILAVIYLCTTRSPRRLSVPPWLLEDPMNYETRKNVWLILIALIFAALAAWLATRWMQTSVAAVDASKLSLSNVVIVARDVPLGKRIEPADVKLVRAVLSSIPPDAFTQTEAAIGHVSKSALLSGEVLIDRRLSKYTGGSALAAILAPGMRAVTVRVDDVIGVGGFVLPENRVDVVAAFQDGNSFRAETILHDIRVLAIDQRSDPGTNEALLVRAVTLEVTPERGRIQLTLLNPIPAEATNDPIDQTEVVVRAPKLIEAGIFPIKTPQLEKARDPSPPVTLIRGTQITTRKSE